MLMGLWFATGLAAGAPELDELSWVVVNDTVMGGVSTGTVEVGDGALKFTGNLSLERNGGFASIRARTPPGAFAEASALRVWLQGDGRTYAVTLRRSDVPLRAGSYRVPVATTTEKAVVEIPMSAFRPTSFGRPVPGAPALDTALDRVDSIGFMLADKRPGAFALEIHEVEVVRTLQAHAGGRAQVDEALQRALSVGVPAFNEGDAQTCRALYAETLEELAGHPAITAGERSIVDEALASARDAAPVAAAWTLRGAIDTLMAGGPG